MFSQFRHAVESLATPPRPRSSIDGEAGVAALPDGAAVDANADATAPTTTTPPVGAATNGVLASTSWPGNPLAGAALPSIASLGKLPFGVRSASPARSVGHRRTDSAQEKERRSRVTLEDRLKARFAIGEASPGSTPDPSARNTPLPAANPMSPASTPLPDSPALGPLDDAPLSIGDRLVVADTTIELTEKTRSEDAQPPEPATIHDPQSVPASFVPNAGVSAATPLAPMATTPAAGLSAATDPSPAHVEADMPAGTSASPPEELPAPTAISALPLEIPPVLDTLAPLDADAPPLGMSTSPPETITPALESPAKAAKGDAAAVLPSSIAASPVEVPSSEAETKATIPAAPMVNGTDTASEHTLFVPDVLEALASDNVGAADVEALQERLKLVEQRFTDVSRSFKKLQAEKLAADKVLRELTSVEGIDNVDALRDYLQNASLTVEMAQDEVRRLTGKLSRQDERLQELRDIHHLEAKSQGELIDKLRKQVADGAASLQALQASGTKADEDRAQHKAELERVQSEATRTAALAKEEEEKRVKAISLLKTLRQKLVKTEKERDDALKEVGSAREKDQEEIQKERLEKARLLADIDKVNSERESALAGMKSHFDREFVALKERHQRELAAVKGQFESEAATAKSDFSKQLAAKDNRIGGLERSVQSLSLEKSRLFEQVQMRQAEFESSQTQLEVLQGQTAELNYQLRESADRIALLTEELVDARREQQARPSTSSTSADDAARILALTEAKYEAKLTELRNRVQAAEKERNDGEVGWSRRLDEKVRELDELKRKVDVSTKAKESHEEVIAQARQETERVQEELQAQMARMAELRLAAEQAAESESTATEDARQALANVAALEKALEEAKGRESQLKAGNKTLREELRKVQSSAALFERQRAPGVGYWSATRSGSSTDVPRASMSSTDLPSSPNSPRRETASLNENEEEVNLEYLRNIILQFLEHKDMRPNLVRVLSAVLRFTPQETRRLIAKV